LAEGLPYDVFVIAFSGRALPRQQREHVRFLLLPTAPLAPLRYLTFALFAPLLALWLVARRRVRVVIAQSPYEGALGALLKGLLKLFGVRLALIVENHNNFEEDVFLQRSVRFERLYRGLMGALAGFAFRHADAVRVISTSTHERALAYAPHAPQVRFMTWTDSDAFRHAVRPAPPSACELLVYAGVLIPRKGVHRLLEAFAQVPHGTLALVGGEENASYARELREQARTLGIAERVAFVGAVDQATLADYFCKARAMVLPSLSEGLGRVIVEAMLCGAPVVASAVGGIPDLVRDGENGYLVPPNDSASLALRLRQLYESTDVDVLGRQAQTFAQAYFSPQAYLEGYQRLIALAERAL
jgi:glycosyltransferase involved in cell wall biosynthesis